MVCLWRYMEKNYTYLASASLSRKMKKSAEYWSSKHVNYESAEVLKFWDKLCSLCSVQHTWSLQSDLFQASFTRLLSHPVCGERTISQPHYSSLLLLSLLVPISAHLFWASVRWAVVGIPDKVLLCNWSPFSFCWKSSWGLLFAFSWLYCIWTDGHPMFRLPISWELVFSQETCFQHCSA